MCSGCCAGSQVVPEESTACLHAFSFFSTSSHSLRVAWHEERSEPTEQLDTVQPRMDLHEQQLRSAPSLQRHNRQLESVVVADTVE